MLAGFPRHRARRLADMPGVKPGRYMTRYHWITIVDARELPEAYLREFVHCSYDRARASLSKARRKELSGS